MKKLLKYKNILITASLLVLAAAAIVYLGIVFSAMHEEEPIYAGKGVTKIEMLSDYYPALKGTYGDTEIYVLDSGKPGASMLVLGGTHPNEPSGFITAVLLIENCVPEEGVLYVHKWYWTGLYSRDHCRGWRYTPLRYPCRFG